MKELTKYLPGITNDEKMQSFIEAKKQVWLSFEVVVKIQKKILDKKFEFSNTSSAELFYILTRFKGNSY